MESEHDHNELHQLHQITTLQDMSMGQISFISNQMLDESNTIDEELLKWEDFSSDEDDEPALDRSGHDKQNTRNQNRDLGDSTPGEDT
jgi:hypothetical protein